MRGPISTWEPRIDHIRAEWRAVTELPTPSMPRFEQVKREAGDLISAGRWTSGPPDLLSILGRQRHELTHSRVIGWLLNPTGSHELGRAFLCPLLDAVWPGEALMRTGAVIVETEVTSAAFDPDGRLRESRADIVVRGDRLTVVIENKLDAGEGHDQCERLYWGWAAEPGDTGWLFLTTTGRGPVTATSDEARAAWRSLSYEQFRDVLASALDRAASSPSIGRASAVQYLTTLARAVAP